MKEGEILAVIGKSGSGKTTLLKCVYGLEDLQSGEIHINNEKVTGPAYNLIPGNRNMSLVSQDFYVLDNHTVTENINDKLTGYTDEAKQKRCNNLLQLLELSLLRDTKARFLSSGQKQRVAIARALAEIPPLLLLDEPFSNLDHLLTEKLFAFIMREVKRRKTAVILITHLAEEALKYADRIAVMDKGRIVQQGQKWDVYYRPKNNRLAGLLGEYNLLSKDDLVKGSKAHKLARAKKIFVRPDRFIPARKENADILLQIIQSTYNGKCHEILAETPEQRQVLLYSAKGLDPGKELAFSISF